MSEDKVEEPFQVPKDYTRGFHLTKEDMLEKKNEIRNQIMYLLNMEKQIDEVYESGDYVLSEDELRNYLRIESDGNIPKDIPKIRVGMKFVYYMKDVKRFLEARKRTGR